MDPTWSNFSCDVSGVFITVVSCVCPRIVSGDACCMASAVSDIISAAVVVEPVSEPIFPVTTLQAGRSNKHDEIKIITANKNKNFFWYSHGNAGISLISTVSDLICKYYYSSLERII